MSWSPSSSPKDAKSLSLRTHSQTSGWSLTAQDPFNNVARTCIEAMAATQGHTQSLHTNALDEALALPTDFSARIARNTQLLLQQESGTTRPIDPWGGSYYVEWLTHQLAEKRTRAHIREVNEHGGMAQAISDGIPKLRIEEAAARTQARIDSGQQPVIGVNKYQVDEDHEIEVLKVENSRVRAEQIAKLEQLRADRDPDAVDAALDELARAADAGSPPGRLRRRGQPARAGHRRRAGQGHGRRDLRCAGEGLGTASGRDPYHRRGLPRRSRRGGNITPFPTRPNSSRSSPRPTAAGPASWSPRWARTGTTAGRR